MLGELADAHESAGDWRRAADTCRTLVAADPLDEGAGGEPSAATAELHRRIVAGEPV